MMAQEDDRDFYRVWVEYLIRTPAYLRWADWMERTYSGEYVRWPAELDAFSLGYDAWLKHDLPHEVVFDRVYYRLFRRRRMTTQAEQHQFTPSAEIAWNTRQNLEIEREDLVRTLTWKEEEALIEKVVRDTLTERGAREREYLEGFKQYRYRSKPPKVKWGAVISGTLKRRLTYYHLVEICCVSRDEIILGDALPLGTLPFGTGPFSPDPKEIDFFRYWKRGFAKRDPRHFLSEELSEARKVIAAVENGWFPSPPPPFKNCTMENPAR